MPTRILTSAWLTVAFMFLSSTSWASEGPMDPTLLGLIAFSAFFIIGLVLSGVYVHLRESRRRAGASVEFDRRHPGFEVEPSELVTARSKPAEPLGAVETHAGASIRTQLLFRRSEGGKVCPTCSRRFGEEMGICPYDATPLQRGEETRQVVADEPFQQPGCPECGRIFEKGAKYCRKDGSKLIVGRVRMVLSVHVCRECGYESAERIEGCCDAPEHVLVDPTSDALVPPMLPMNICGCCHGIYPSNATHCPVDGEVLRPMMNLRFRYLAPTGVGPRRKVCEGCGRKYSSSANYCMADGRALSAMN